MIAVVITLAMSKKGMAIMILSQVLSFRWTRAKAYSQRFRELSQYKLSVTGISFPDHQLQVERAMGNASRERIACGIEAEEARKLRDATSGHDICKLSYRDQSHFLKDSVEPMRSRNHARGSNQQATQEVPVWSVKFC